MPDRRDFRSLSPNARFGVAGLVLSAIGLSASIWSPGAVPMHLLFFGILVFGQWAYGQEAGLEKPLTKLMLVALSFAALGFVLFKIEASAGGGLLFAFAGAFTILIWAIAMLHRPGPARQAGKVGMVAGGVSLAILIGGHVFVGLGAALGLGALRNAGTATAQEVTQLVQIICLCLSGWGLVCAWLMFMRYVQDPKVD